MLLGFVACCVACTTATVDGPVQIQVRGADGSIPSSFVVRLSSDSATGRLVCPSSEVGPFGARCNGAGFRVDAPPAAADLMVKSRGLRTASGTLSASGWQAARQPGGLALLLTALPPAVSNADYATALQPSAGAAAFEALAYASPTELGAVQSLKFFVRKLDTATPEVYFQNTRKHFIHADFAHNVLGEPGTASEFAEKTYSGASRTQMAGTLVRYPAVTGANLADGTLLKAPVCLTFFPSDDLTPGMAARVHRLLEERLGFVALSGGENRLVYLPAGTRQESEAQAASAQLQRADVRWLNHTALYGGLTLQVLNPGISYGTLRRVTPEDLAQSIVSFTDILLLTRLPNALPIVGGTIVEELQTPLAHVNVAAHTRGLPNISLLGASEDPRVKPFIGKLVRFEAKAGTFSLTEASLDEAKAWWTQGKKAPFVPLFDDDFGGLPDLATLHFGDSLRVGVKAANVAELSQLLGEHAPTGFAVPFRHYHQFMQTGIVTAERCEVAQAECVASGRATALCQGARSFCALPDAATETLAHYAERLIDDAALATDAPALEANLASLASVMRQTPIDASLAADLQSAISQRFGTGKVRLRSSTNSEDLPGFSGAGMYTSVSATAGAKNPVAVQIREVWSSVWSWRAFEERAWWNIDHRAVRMGVLVHQSFPDEQANGVLITQNISDLNTVGMYVNVQQGEISVTNPTDGAIAEVFAIVPGPAGLQVQRLRFSSLSPDAALLSEAEVKDLFGVATQVQKHFAPLYKQSADQLALDMEFKFEGPQRALFIKQVRPYVAAPSP